MAVGSPGSDGGGLTGGTRQRHRLLLIEPNGTDPDGDGLVQVFQRISSRQWVQLGQDLTFNSFRTPSLFGYDVDLDDSGFRLAVGVPGFDGDTGIVLSYDYDESTQRWIPYGGSISTRVLGGRLGSSVALSGNGNIIVASAPRNDVNGTDSGRVFVSRINPVSGFWEAFGQEFFGNGDGDLCGCAVSISQDGFIVAFGCPGSGQNAGRVFIYEYSAASSAWSLVGSPINGRVAGEQCGVSLELSNRGNRLVYGCPQTSADFTTGQAVGAVRVASLVSGEWQPLGQEIQGQSESMAIGSSVSISGDGQEIAFFKGNYFSGQRSSIGEVDILEFDGTSFVQIGPTIRIDDTPSLPFALDLNEDGLSIVIGAVGVNDSGSAQAYQFVRDTTPAPTPSPSRSRTIAPTNRPSNNFPSATPTGPRPTQSPTLSPTQSAAPSTLPSNDPSGAPSDVGPTPLPTVAPSPAGGPTLPPTAAPSAAPTSSPSTLPTNRPTSKAPSAAPSTASPVTPAPTNSGSQPPTTSPSTLPPSNTPSVAPSAAPATASPSNTGSQPPTTIPTTRPTSMAPSAAPATASPSSSISQPPTNSPTTRPTSKAPSAAPATASPSNSASQPPTISPTTRPTSKAPTTSPSISASPSPSQVPSQSDGTTSPTQAPAISSPAPATVSPSGSGSKAPTLAPTIPPSSAPTSPKTSSPSTRPVTAQPGAASVAPTMAPVTSAPSSQPVASRAAGLLQEGKTTTIRDSDTITSHVPSSEPSVTAPTPASGGHPQIIVVDEPPGPTVTLTDMPTTTHQPTRTHHPTITHQPSITHYPSFDVLTKPITRNNNGDNAGTFFLPIEGGGLSTPTSQQEEPDDDDKKEIIVLKV
jgi:hypothetical protein